MKTITLKNGMVIFVEQIAFIHIQPASRDDVHSPEIHVHFSAGLSSPKGSRSMRVVISDDLSADFINQLEAHGVDGSHMRNRLLEMKRAGV